MSRDKSFRMPWDYGFWYALAACVVIMSALVWYTEAKNFQEFLRLLNVALSLGVVTAYFPESFRRACKPRLESADLLLIGITIGWFGQAAVSTWVLMWRLAGQPSWMINSDITNWTVGIQVAGCALHLVAPGAISGMVPRRNMVALGCLTALSAAVVLIFLTESPQISSYLKRLRPAFEAPGSNYESSQLNRAPENVTLTRWQAKAP